MIFRTAKNRENPYVMLNKELLHDSSISWKAKGLLAMLLSRPDDWQFYEAELTKHAADGRDSTRSGIKELIAAGYIVRGNRVRDSRGRFKEYEYVVHEIPRQPGLPSTDGFSNVGESNTTNKRLNQRRKNHSEDLADALDRGIAKANEFGDPEWAPWKQ